jgi:capsular exopolysaccharide synthesis family protein
MPNNDERSSGGYGSYGGYYYGEGYGGGYADAAVSPSRGLKDYLIILRERIWWLVTTVFVVFLGVALFTFNSTKLYKATSSVHILRAREAPVDIEMVSDDRLYGTEDLQTQINILESLEITRAVDKRIQGAFRKRFVQPYESGIDSAISGEREALDILFANRIIQPQRLSFFVYIHYVHPDPDVAAQVANLFAEAYIQFSKGQTTETTVEGVEELAQKVKFQAERVREVEERITEFKSKHGITFDERQDIDSQELIQLRTLLTEAKRDFDEKKTYYEQVLKARENGTPLQELAFIGNDPAITRLSSELSSLKVEQATLARRYGPKHPKMFAVTEAANQLSTELNQALERRAQGTINEYDRARENWQLSEANLRAKEKDILLLDRLRPEYNALIRDMAISQNNYEATYARYQQLITIMDTEGDSARIIDRATPPPESNPFKPNTVMNLGIGLVLGLGMGFGLVVLLAVLDDKVKTAFDIETTIGIPLVGIVPRISMVDATQKARVVLDSLDKHSLEAFRAIHSTLKISEESRSAKVILTTSTIPSEGKSFISTNLAFTFANHSERTLILDCDLRMPNVGKSLNISNKVGIIQVLDGRATLDEAIIKDFAPGLDVLVTGGRSKNPTQLLSSTRFEEVLEELRGRYDKIMIDCPPLAPVSDALNILSLVDGVIYVVRFNMVKRKTAAINVKRLRESNVTILGAVLNNINTNVAGYYYSHYYDSSYRHYYVRGGAETPAEASADEEDSTVSKLS